MSLIQVASEAALPAEAVPAAGLFQPDADSRELLPTGKPNATVVPGGAAATAASPAAATGPVQLAAAPEPRAGAFLGRNAIRPLPQPLPEGAAGAAAALPDHQLVALVGTHPGAAATPALAVFLPDL